MATEINQLDSLKHIMAELSDHDRVVESFSADYESVEVPSDGVRVVREHTGRRTYSIVTIPKPTP